MKHANNGEKQMMGKSRGRQEMGKIKTHASDEKRERK
jgi:hypothetical protein